MTYPYLQFQEFLRGVAHLRPRTNTISAVTRVRSALAYATHSYFQEEGFFYLQSPLITASDCEGAGELFRVTTLPLDDVSKVCGLTLYSDFFSGFSQLPVDSHFHYLPLLTSFLFIFIFIFSRSLSMRQKREQTFLVISFLSQPI